MSTEQEALRLADLLQDEAGVDGYVHDEAAAMLRKLVAEREADRAAMREVLWHLEHASGESNGIDENESGNLNALVTSLNAAITHLRQRLEGTT